MTGPQGAATSPPEPESEAHAPRHALPETEETFATATTPESAHPIRTRPAERRGDNEEPAAATFTQLRRTAPTSLATPKRVPTRTVLTVVGLLALVVWLARRRR